ncbi:MAG: flavodoxin family protein [Candidatus Thorarchaeota archaeon]
MKRALVLYHSLFGNTRSVAMALARGIQEQGIETDCMSIDEVDMQEIPDYDFLAIGGPTHMIRPSKEMKEFLQRLKTLNLEGKSGFAFDTRNQSRMNQRSWFVLENSAARGIEGQMKKLGIHMIRPRESAIVIGREGPLNEGVESMFSQIGKFLGTYLTSHSSQEHVSSSHK